MPTLTRLLILAGLLVGAGSASADHICTNSPDEVYVANAPDPLGNPTVPICRWKEAPQQQAEPQPEAPQQSRRYLCRIPSFSALLLDHESGYQYTSEKQTAAQFAVDQVVSRCLMRGTDPAVCNNRQNVYAWTGCAVFARELPVTSDKVSVRNFAMTEPGEREGEGSVREAAAKEAALAECRASAQDPSRCTIFWGTCEAGTISIENQPITGMDCKLGTW